VKIMAQEKKKEELELLVNILIATPTQNLQVAQQLINLSNKINQIIAGMAEIPQSLGGARCTRCEDL